MKLRHLATVFLLVLAARSLPAATATLELVASLPEHQVTGVALSKTGRIFVNFPDWSDHHSFSVAEIVNGKPQPFPNEKWNETTGAPEKGKTMTFSNACLAANWR